jgi:nicotinamidase-related amidase
MVSSQDLSSFQIKTENTALCIVDFQERLAAVMPAAEREACERNISLLLDLAARLGWPVLVCEQYPKGLGNTVAALAKPIDAFSGNLLRLEKLHFSATAAPEFGDLFARIDRTQWIVTGMETHVCVFQTVRGLLQLGAAVQVPEDAVVSRSSSNRTRGLALMQSMGALITCTETVIFDALGVAGTDTFKAMSRQLR